MSEQDNLQKADGKEEIKDLTETVEQITEETIDTSTEENHDEDQAVVNEIDASNAEDAEDEGNKDRHTIEEKDYHAMSMDSLVIEFEKLVDSEKIQAIKSHVDTLKNEFNDKFNALLEEKKDEFLNDGGNEIDFYYSSPLKKKFNQIYKDYKGKLHAHYKNIETNLKGNLSNRLQIIEDIKALMDDAEDSMNTKYKQFKALQDKWKTAGPIPRDKYNNAWNSYHFNVEKFYDLLHLDRDLRDKDFEHNLEQKTKIIERAEELAQDDNTNRAFRELQVLHQMWKEELGPVAREYRDDIWNKFKAATKTIHKKRQEYFEDLDKIYEKNLEKKNEIIEKIKNISIESVTKHSGWQNKIKEIESFRDEFFKAGKVPIKVNEATWAKFKEAVRDFNKKKNSFYKGLKKDQFDNLKKKQELIKIAEENKDSEDIETTTSLMKKIQSDWKNIGHVPRKDSDKIWKQFKGACNHFFDRLHAERDSANKVEDEAFEKKTELLESLKTLELTKDKDESLKTINSKIEEWKTIGRVPFKKQFIEGKFNKILDTLYGTLDMDKTEVELIKFENKVEALNNLDDSRKLDNEHTFIRKKITEVKGEINQLQNNLLFFKHADEKNPLVKSVHDNIKKHEESLAIWKAKSNKIKAIFKAEAQAEAQAKAATEEALAIKTAEASDEIE